MYLRCIIFISFWVVYLTCLGPLVQRKTFAEGCSSSLPNSELSWPRLGQTPYVGILTISLNQGPKTIWGFSKLNFTKVFRVKNANLVAQNYLKNCLLLELAPAGHPVRFLWIYFVPRQTILPGSDYLTHRLHCEEICFVFCLYWYDTY